MSQSYIGKAGPILVVIPLMALIMALIAGGKFYDGPKEQPLGYMVGCFSGAGSRAVLRADQHLVVDGKQFHTSRLLEENGHYWIETNPGFNIKNGKVVPSVDHSSTSRIEVFHHGAPGAAIRFWGANSTSEMPWLKRGCRAD